MYSNFMFLDRVIVQKHTHTRTQTRTHKERLYRVLYSCVFEKGNYKYPSSGFMVVKYSRTEAIKKEISSSQCN